VRLRPYQHEAVRQTLDAFREHQRVLLVMPTGVGKTVVFCHLAREMMDGGRVLIMAHRDELIQQACEKVRQITGHTPDVEKADSWAAEDIWPSRIVVTSVQTQVAGMGGKGRMTRFDPSDFRLLIVDEAHHATARTYRRVIDHYASHPGCRVLGVTATPNRADEKALGMVFGHCAYEYGIQDAIHDGWLVPITQEYCVVESLDLSLCRTTAGDLNGRDLEAAVAKEEVVMGCVPRLLDLNGRTIVFTASVFHAELVAAALNGGKPDSAAVVSAKTRDDQRAGIFRAFHEGRVQYLCNVGIATEGFDEPLVDNIAVLRPTKSLPLYTQIIGRGTRPLPGLVDGIEAAEVRRQAIAASAKPHVRVVDFVGNAGRHKLVSSVDVLGGDYDDDVLDLAKTMARESDEKPVESLLAEAEAELARRRREQLRIEAARRAQVTAKYRTYQIDPFGVFEITPWRERSWDKYEPATEKQVAMLRRNGVDTEGMTKRRAMQIIKTIIDRRRRHLCSFKQARILAARGYDTHVTIEEASRLIDEIARREGWKSVRKPKRYAGAAVG